MKLSEKDIARLEDYWNGQLDSKEIAALEEELNSNQAFKAAADNWYLMVKQGFGPTDEELKEQEQIRDRFRGYSAELKESLDDKPNKPFIYRRLFIGLSLAACLVLIVWLSPLNRLLVGGDDYDQYFSHLDRDNANLSDTAMKGQEAYDQRKYRLAYPALLEETANGGDSLNIIYAAVAAIGSEQAEAAIPLLEPLLRQEGWQLYQAELQWYLALAYLQQKEVNKAKQLLEELANTDESYAPEAEALLLELNKN